MTSIYYCKDDNFVQSFFFIVILLLTKRFVTKIEGTGPQGRTFAVQAHFSLATDYM